MRSIAGLPRRRLGINGPEVTAVALGTSPLGGAPDTYGYDVAEVEAVNTVREFLTSQINFIDTSNEYGGGGSERRIGAAFQSAQIRRGDVVIATKADPPSGSRDFSAARVRNSFQESTGRLGVDYVDVFYLHDPERFPFRDVTMSGGALDAAIQLRDEGKVGMVGVAGGDLEEMRRYLDTGKLDALLNHSQFNLIDRSANTLIDDAIAAGVPFVNAAPYASGILAKGAGSSARFQYREPTDEVARIVARIDALARQHEVSLPALALQFSTRDPRITSTVVGVSSPARVRELSRSVMTHLPDEIWGEVDQLLSA